MADNGGRAIRILIEHSDYWLTNKGDLAMLDVTVTRLHDHWPSAQIGVLTETPALLRSYFPRAEPITPWGKTAWGRPGPLGRLAAKAAPKLVGPVAIGWITARVEAQLTARRLSMKLRSRLERRRSGTQLSVTASLDSEQDVADPPIPPNTAEAVKTASLVLALGGGYLTDADPVQSKRVLNLLKHARSLGTPAVMIGQGLGPMESTELLSRAAEVLPHVDFLGLRESRCGPQLLARVGVSMERVMVTGDDAIALAHSMCRDDIGSDIGICLRIAEYSPVTDRARDGVAHALHTVAAERHASLVPVIIAEYKSQDRRSTLPLVEGFPLTRRPLGRFSRSRDVAAHIGGCRVLVTGAYHAAVFSLSQGIPVVALSTSRYYDDKFLGLADMFGGGVHLVRLDADDSSSQLAKAIREAWEEAPHVRPTLRASAERQIVMSRAGVERVVQLLDTASSDSSEAS